MNLYLVLALALGVSAPSASPRVTGTAAVTRVASHRVALATRGWPLTVHRSPQQHFSANGERRTANEAPLTGAASPRAPAFSC